MTRWINLRNVLLVGLALLVLLVLFAHPFFAPTRPSGAKVLVAEGWMPRERMNAAAELFHAGGYEQLYVSGTLRPFAYYLEHGDTLEVLPHVAFTGSIKLGTAGLPGTMWRFLSEQGELAQGVPAARATDTVIDTEGEHTVLRITAEATDVPGEGVPVLFISTVELNGEDPHALRQHVRILRANGSIESGRPTWAEEGAALLMEAGVPAASVTAVPTYSATDRTRAAAKEFARYAAEHELEGYDVVTLGVHTRRTWKQYARASAPIPVGVVALQDPQCKRWTWWLSPYGWFQVMKEVGALPGVVW